LKSRIYIGDSREIIPELNEEFKNSITLLFTSPPYFVARGYEEYIKSEEHYWDIISDVFTKSLNLIEGSGKVAVNFADRYANYKHFGRSLEITYVPNYVDIFSEQCDLWGRIIWDKKRVMLDGARHISNSGRFTGRMRISPNWEYIFIWRKSGPMEDKEVDMQYEEWRDWVDGVWQIPCVNTNEQVGDTKLAKFPEELAYRLIKMYSEPGDIILDPFVGSGTVVKVANELNRVGIGIDKNPEMLELLQANLTDVEYYNRIGDYA
jgi:DNA modification methylase